VAASLGARLGALPGRARIARFPRGRSARAEAENQRAVRRSRRAIDLDTCVLLGAQPCNRPVWPPFHRHHAPDTLRPIHALSVACALTSIITNARVAVTDGTDADTRSHDAVVVDLKSASARFVKSGTPLAANERSIIIELLAPPIGPLPNTTGLPNA